MKILKISTLVLLLIITCTACGTSKITGSSMNNSISTGNNLNNTEATANTAVNVTNTDEAVNDLQSENTEGNGQVLTGEFSSFSSTDLEGNAVTQDILLGNKLIFINIWGTFCGPCINEMPDLGQLAEEYKDKGVLFVGIPIDVSDAASISTAVDIVAQTKANYIHILPSQDLIDIYLGSVNAVPTTLILDDTGTILNTYIGSNNKAGWEEIIDSYLTK